MFLSVIVVIILFNVIYCQKIEKTWNLSNSKNGDEIYIVTHPSTDNAVSTRRTFVPSFRVILLEISLMAISVFLVNSLENYIKPAKNRPKHRRMEEENIYRNVENIIRNFK